MRAPTCQDDSLILHVWRLVQLAWSVKQHFVARIGIMNWFFVNLALGLPDSFRESGGLAVGVFAVKWDSLGFSVLLGPWQTALDLEVTCQAWKKHFLSSREFAKGRQVSQPCVERSFWTLTLDEEFRFGFN